MDEEQIVRQISEEGIAGIGVLTEKISTARNSARK
jgi:hypothetical protein